VSEGSAPNLPPPPPPAMGKSESEFKALEAKIEALTKSMQDLASRPVRRAVTEVSEQPTLSKAEVDKAVKRMIARGEFKKSDADLLISYTMGTVGIKDIQHLLK